MKKTLKKSLALVLTVLMLMTSVPFGMSFAAETKTLAVAEYGLIRGGSSSRLNGSTFNIVNDSQADNTSAGIMRFDISSFVGYDVTSATLTAKVENVAGEARPTGYYYSTNVQPSYLGNAEHQISITTGGWYTGRNSLLKACGITGSFIDGQGGENAPQKIGVIAANSTASTTMDLTSALSAAVSQNLSDFYVIVVKDEAGSGGSDGGWTDTNVTVGNHSISVTAEKKSTSVDGVDVALFEALKTEVNNYTSVNPAAIGGFKDDNNYNNYADHWKGLLWAETSIGHQSATEGVQLGSDWTGSNTAYANMYVPTAVALYKAGETVTIPVMTSIAVSRSGTWDCKFKPWAVSLNTAGLALTSNQWNGKDQNDGGSDNCYANGNQANNIPHLNFMWTINQTNYTLGTNSSTGGTGSEIDPGYGRKAQMFANKIKINDTFASSETISVKKYNPKFNFYVTGKKPSSIDSSKYIDFPNSSDTIYYIDYQSFLNKMDAVKTDLAVITNPNKYTVESFSKYLGAIKKLLSIEAASYPYSTNTESAVNSFVYDMNFAINAYNEAKANLVPQYEIKFVDHQGDTVSTQWIVEGATPEVPATNTATITNDTDTHTVYTWPAVSAVAKADVTYNEIATTTAHDFVSQSVVTAAACEKNRIDHVKCSTCGQETNKAIAGTALEHQYVETVVPAGCETEGYSQFECSVCHKTYKDNYTDPEGHKYTSLVTPEFPSTCTVAGTAAVYKCENCDATTGGEALELADHTPVVIPAKAATCQHAGSTEGSECSVCGTILVNPVNIPAVAHKYGEYVYNNDATCGEDGTETATCIYAYDGCQLSVSRKAVGSSASVEHVWGEGVVTTPATCKTKGVMTFTCENCTNTKTEETELDATNHDSWTVQTAKKEATCGKDGAEAIYVCGCGDATKGGETIPATGNHELRLVANRIDAKCNAEGKTAVYGCKNCDYTEGGETIPFAEHSYKNVVTPPTCTVPGYTTKICKDCGANGGIIPGSETTKEHNYTVVVDPEDPATCSTTGKTAVMKCSDCDAITGGETIEIVADAHVLETVAAQASTCTVKGWNEYKKCTLCDYNTKVELALAAHDYEVTTPEKPATCSATGTTAIKTCKNCDATIGGDEIDVIPNAHVLETVEAQASTCTVRGWKEYKQCTLCDYNTKVLLPLAEHNYEETAPEVHATCVNPGTTAVETCTECGNTIGGQVIPATGKHSFTVLVTPEVPATCTEPGTKAVMKCATCDETSGGTSITRLGHDIINHDGKEPTCTEPGNTAYKTCSRCDYTNYGEIPARGHDFKNVVAEKVGATCGADGSTVVMGCTRCDATTGGDVIPATGEHINSIILKAEVPANCVTDGATAKVQCEVCNTITESTVISATGVHTFTVEVSPMVPATCVDNGKTAVMKCANCEATSGGEVITANGEHDFRVLVSAKKEATCAADGKTAVYKCANCDEVTGGEKINALAHDLVSVTAKAPTCKEDGYNTHVYCKNCDYTTKVIRPATGAHKFTVLVAKEVKATCTEDGTTAIYKCSVCGTTNGGEKIDALNHDLIDIEAQAPTCCEEGWNAYQECSRCDYTTFESISATGIHSYTVLVSAKLDATCEEDGAEAVYKCATCDATIGGDVIPATGHNDGDKNGLCDECGSPVDCDHTNTTLTGAKDPDCVRKGYTGDKVCDECGTIVEKGKYIPALGHTVVKDPAVKATCLEGGLTEGSHCSVCGIILEGQLPTAKGNHTKAVKPGKEATCSEYGYTEEIYCSVCDKVLERSQPTEKLNHKDENHDGNCDECGVSISAACNCICHKKSWISRLIYKILRFFWKLFKIGHSCACGTVHY